MDDKTSGASAAQTGLSPSAEPVPVSSANAASIPSAETFGVINDYGFNVVLITKVTAQQFCYREPARRERKAYLEKLVAWGLSEQQATHLSQRLSSVEAERDRRLTAARAWYNKEVAKLAASVMSAQRAETEGLSPQDASAVGASRDAHPSSEQSS